MTLLMINIISYFEKKSIDKKKENVISCYARRFAAILNATVKKNGAIIHHITGMKQIAKRMAITRTEMI